MWRNFVLGVFWVGDDIIIIFTKKEILAIYEKKKFRKPIESYFSN